MRRIPIQDLKPEMVVARAIYNSEGRILLHAGIKLSETYIYRLHAAGILSVYIRDDIFDDLDHVEDVISEETRLKTIKTIKDNFQGLEKQHKLNVRLVKDLVDEIIDELLFNPNILVNLSDIRAFDDYTFAHSVNVCILSIMTGISLQYNPTALKELGIGALLHDIGKTKIDKQILNKPDDLTREECEEVKRHTQLGFDILRQYSDVSLLSAHIAYQHHERWDGQGYPRKLSGDKIHPYARIVAVADVYDALVADRPYRPAYSVIQAITVLKRMGGLYLDPEFIRAFLTNIASYPIGSFLELNGGEIGIVVDINKEAPNRPVVKIIYDRNLRPLSSLHEVDLSKLSTISINRILSEKDIRELRFYTEY